MAITPATSTGQSAMWQQLQTQQAQRAADQAAQTARTLQAQASEARATAQRAQQSARALEVKANQAQDAASQASQNVRSAQSLGEVQTKLSNVYGNLPQAISQNNQAVGATAPTATTAASSTTAVGTVINTTA